MLRRRGPLGRLSAGMDSPTPTLLANELRSASEAALPAVASTMGTACVSTTVGGRPARMDAPESDPVSRAKLVAELQK